MTVEQKIIRNKVGLLQLAKQLGACPKHARSSGIQEIAFTDSKSFMRREANWLFKK